MLKIFLAIIVLAALLVLLPRVVTWVYSLGRVHPAAEAPPLGTAVVFGAGLWRDGSPTPVLRDRVRAAAQLFFAGKVDRLIMSGTVDNYYNEPRAMRNYAMELGVPNEVITQDYGGLRTYDTCLRARDLYGVENAILVTQNFHLPRALYICNQLGVKSAGVAADLQYYRKRSRLWWNLREIPATMVALWEVHISPPPPPVEIEPAETTSEVQ